MDKVIELNNGIKINLDWLYPKEERKPVSKDDWDDDECQILTEEPPQLKQ